MLPALFLLMAAVTPDWAAPSPVSAASIHDYVLVSSFQLPEGAGPVAALNNGRLVTLRGTEVLLESAVGTRSFDSVGTLLNADFSPFGAVFLRPSPDGTRIAVGNDGGASFAHHQVGVFSLADLNGRWFSAVHFDAAWTDDRHLAMTGGVFGQPAFVSLLDTFSVDEAAPTNPKVISNIGGASGGIALDAERNLYTGNGFATTGPSGTGAVRVFDAASWSASAGGADPIDFETGGLPVVDLLSASPLGFDSWGNLFIGGGEFFGTDVNYAAILNASAIELARMGAGPINPFDSTIVRRLDPDPDNDRNVYDLLFNSATSELYLIEGGTVYTYVVPEPAVWVLGVVLLLGRIGVPALKYLPRISRSYVAGGGRPC